MIKYAWDRCQKRLLKWQIRKILVSWKLSVIQAYLLLIKSICYFKREGKVVCGTGDGVLNIFNWGEWGNISDRFPGHPMSVDCMVQVTEDIICTGSIDGIIRLVFLVSILFHSW